MLGPPCSFGNRFITKFHTVAIRRLPIVEFDSSQIVLVTTPRMDQFPEQAVPYHIEYRGTAKQYDVPLFLPAASSFLSLVSCCCAENQILMSPSFPFRLGNKPGKTGSHAVKFELFEKFGDFVIHISSKKSPPVFFRIIFSSLARS